MASYKKWLEQMQAKEKNKQIQNNEGEQLFTNKKNLNTNTDNSRIVNNYNQRKQNYENNILLNRDERLSIARNANNNINNRIQENKPKIDDIVSKRKELVDYNRNNRKNLIQIRQIDSALQNRNFKSRQPQNIMLNDIAKTKSTNIQNTNLFDFVNSSKKNDFNYIGRKFGVGIQSGFTSIPDAFLTDAANNIQKGGKSIPIVDLAKKFINDEQKHKLELDLQDENKRNTLQNNPINKLLNAINLTKSALDSGIPIKQILTNGIDTIKDINELKDKIYNGTLTKDEYLNFSEKHPEYITLLNNLSKDTDNWQKVGAVLGFTGSKITNYARKNSAINIIDTGLQSIGNSLGNNKSQEVSKNMIDFGNKITKPARETQKQLNEESNQYGKTTNLIANIAGTVGNMVPSITAGIVNPSLGLAVTGVSSKGQATRKALYEGLSLEEANLKGDASGAMEVLTEKLSGGVKIFGKGTLDNIVEKNIKKLTESEVKRKLLQLGYDYTGEVAEEIASDVYNTWLDNATTDPNAKYTAEDLKDTILTTLGSTLALRGINTGINKALNRNISNNQKIADNNENQSTRIENNAQNLQEQQITQDNTKVAENGNMEQINENDNLISSAEKYNYNFEHKSIQNIQKVLDKKEIQGQFNDSYFNDKNEGAKIIISTDGEGNTSRKIVFNPNADESTIIQEMAVHELTHDIFAKNTKTGQSLYNEVSNYLKSDVNYKENLQNLRESYLKIKDKNGTNVFDENDSNFESMLEEEAIAKAMQTKFGTQEEINRLVRENRTLSQKIYDWIVDKIDTFKNRKDKEYLFWKDVQKKFEKAYNEDGNYNYNEQIKYSFNYVDDFNLKEYNATNPIRIENRKTFASIADSVGRATENQEIFPGINSIELFDYGDNKYHIYDIYYKDRANWKIINDEIVNEDDNYGNERYSRKANTGDEGTRGKNSNDKINNGEIRNKGTMPTNDGLLNQNEGYTYTSRKNNNESNRNIEKIENSEKSSFSTPKQDSIGRKLSEKQQEYFKDSKVRDDYGNLITMYHGTPNEFTIFDKNRISENTHNAGNYGDGFYFTNDSKMAESFSNGNKPMEVYLNVKNPFSYNELYKINGEEFQSDFGIIYNLVNLNNEWAGIPTKYGSNQTWGDIANDISNMIKNGMTDEQIDHDIYSKYGEITGLEDLNTRLYDYSKIKKWKTLSEILEKQGYDAIINGDTPSTSREIVVFNPDQIKNVDNKQPTNNPDIRYSNNSKDFDTYLENKIGKEGTRTSLKDLKLPIAKVNNKNTQELEKSSSIKLPRKEAKLENTFPKRRVEVVKEISKKKDNEASLLEKMNSDKLTLKQQYGVLNQKIVNKGYYIDRLADKTGNQELKYKYDRMIGASSEGQYEIEHAQTNNEGKEIGKSINEIWKPVEDADLVKEFSYYLLHKLNIDRFKRKKPVFGEDITSEISESVAKNYEKLYPEFQNWSKDVNTFNKNQLQNMVNAGLTSEEAQEFLNDTYENYVTVSRDIDKSNNILPTKGRITGTNNPIKKAIGGNSDIQPLKDSMAKQAIAVKQAIRRNDLGLELMKVLKNSENAENVDINNIVSVDSKGNGTFIVFNKGKAKALKIDKGLYESLKTTQKSDLENTFPVKGVQKLLQTQRSLLTVDNPLFIITNFVKDLQDGMFNSKYTAKFLPNYGRALKEIATKGKYYKQYTANGGESNTYFDYETGVKKAPTKVGKFIDKIRSVNEVIEMAPRLSEFISTIEDGKSMNEAMYNAAEITTNFKRGGELTKVINRNGVNFLNASIQGLSKQVRNITGANGIKGYANLLAKATFLGVVPSVINHLLLDDDEEYQDLPDYVKDTYYLFKTNNGFIRIPKGRVLSIFGSSAIRTLSYAQGDKEAFKGIFKTFSNQMAPNNPLTSNIFSPVIQAGFNKTWFDGDLVPTRLKNELPKNQYDESTDSLSKEIGQIFNVSPIKVNYLLDQYSGGLGDIVLPFLTPQARSNPLTAKFTIDSVLKNKNVSKFYEVIDEQTKLANDVEPTDENILKSKYLSSVQSDISALYKEKRETQLSDLKNDVKKEEVRKIQKQINDLAEKALNNYEKITKGSNYAQIEDVKYYKNADNEWTKLTKEEELKNRNISIKTYADYKQKIYEEQERQFRNVTLKKGDSLKDKDKIKILINSNYTNKEKQALYENYIGQNDETYKIMKMANTDINAYLDYKSQNFESDMEDDGTEKGKAISGSKKEKIYDYLAKSKMTYPQRLLIAGMNNKLQEDERSTLSEYIDNLNLNYDDKKSIYKKLKGSKIMKNGDIDY